MTPKPYNKYYALDLYCKEQGLSHENVVYIGDDYGTGGNDESVYQSDFAYITIDDYRDFPKVIQPLLKQQNFRVFQKISVLFKPFVFTI